MASEPADTDAPSDAAEPASTAAAAEAPDAADAPDAREAPAPPEAPLLTLREPMPAVIDTPRGLAAYCRALAAGTGPVAIDAERASGYRYSSRAYLIQVRREGAGSALIDPIPFSASGPAEAMAPLQEAIGDGEWILHAATQDLPCLAEVGLRPARLFDTELAGRLLGYPRVGLATLVEQVLGRRLRKEHSAVDWSTRPLPDPWLLYAALDVEALIELRAALGESLAETGKTEWATQEFVHLLDFTPAKRAEPWRRTSGVHRVRDRRQLAAVRALWTTRDQIAADRDVTPGRIIPDSAMVAAALAMPRTRRTLLSTKGFHGRGASRHADRWLGALAEAGVLADADLPTRSPRADGPPTVRSWADNDPAAALRLSSARAALSRIAASHEVPAENLLSPDTLRRTLWDAPTTRDPDALRAEVAEQLRARGARPWQRDLTLDALVEAIVAGDAASSSAD